MTKCEELRQLVTKQFAPVPSAWQMLYQAMSHHQRTHPGSTSQQAMTAVLAADPALAQTIRDLERSGHRAPEHLLRPDRPTPTRKMVTQATLLLNKIERLTAERLTKGLSPTHAQAMDTVLQEHPDLYADYRQARREAR